MSVRSLEKKGMTNFSMHFGWWQIYLTVLEKELHKNVEH